MYVNFLKSISFLQGLPDETIHFLASRVKTAKYKKGDFIFHESDKAEAIFFVKSGVVKIKKSSSQGKELIVCIKREGNIFCEVSLFGKPDACYPGTAQAISNTEVLYFLNSDLENIMFMYPDISIEMIRYMGKQLRSFTDILQDIALLDIYRKTIKTLERLAHEFGSKLTCGIKIDLPLTIQELANIIGSTRESVSRIISQLKEQGIISIEGKTITINNWCDFCSMTNETVGA
ncbi:Crp/Fnr family transcriptional regulator [Schinkia sp. CFF1]